MTATNLVHRVCPVCEETIPAEYTTRTVADPESPTGEAEIASIPDMTDYDAHVATHAGVAD